MIHVDLIHEPRPHQASYTLTIKRARFEGGPEERHTLFTYTNKEERELAFAEAKAAYDAALKTLNMLGIKHYTAQGLNSRAERNRIHAS